MAKPIILDKPAFTNTIGTEWVRLSKEYHFDNEKDLGRYNVSKNQLQIVKGWGFLR